MNLAVFLLNNTNFTKEILDVLSLISGQLNNLSIFRMLDDGAVARVLLETKVLATDWNGHANVVDIPKSKEKKEQKLTFFKYLTIFLKS